MQAIRAIDAWIWKMNFEIDSNILFKVEGNDLILIDQENGVETVFENSVNELTRHMKLLIAWISEESAVKKLKESGYVKDVDITFSPFWISTVSSNIDSIEFIIRQEEK